MARAKPIPDRRWPWLVRIILARPRLFLSALIGLAVIAVLITIDWLAASPVPQPPRDWLQCLTNLLIGWDVGLILYLVTTYRMIGHCSIAQIRRQSALQDEGSIAILILTVVAAVMSLAAILGWLITAPENESRDPSYLAPLFLTVMLSWAFIHTIFALHYAHEFYAEHRGAGGGLDFPDDATPNYWDFVYFAFGIGTATQVSDVRVTSKTIRRTVTAHGIVSFLFNVTLLALAVSIANDAIPK